MGGRRHVSTRLFQGAHDCRPGGLPAWRLACWGSVVASRCCLRRAISCVVACPGTCANQSHACVGRSFGTLPGFEWRPARSPARPVEPELPLISCTAEAKSEKWVAFHVCRFAVQAKPRAPAGWTTDARGLLVVVLAWPGRRAYSCGSQSVRQESRLASMEARFMLRPITQSLVMRSPQTGSQSSSILGFSSRIWERSSAGALATK